MKYAVAETRRTLRDRFARYLPVHRSAIAPRGDDFVPDEELLNLLLNIDILPESDIERARAMYNAALPPNGGEPSFDEVIAAGWIRVIWGRVATPFEIDQRARATPTPTALATLLQKRFDEKYSFRKVTRGSVALDSLASEIARGDRTPDSVRSQTPEWIAARLWDRTLSESATHASELRTWVDRWRLLGWPSLVAHKAWSDAAVDAFREAVLSLLETEPGLTGWEDTRRSFIRQISLRTGQPLSVADGHVPALPATLLDRALWLNDLRLEGAIAGMMAANQDFVGLVRLILSDIEEQELAPAPHPIFKRLMDLAVERPEILVVVLFRIRWSPALLADLLLHPATSALACWLIADWPGPSGAWDRELRAKGDKTTKAMAFGDAVSIRGDFLELGSLPPTEAASLLRVVYKMARPVFGGEVTDDRSLVNALRDEIAGQSAEVQRAIFSALASGLAESGLGSAEFAAALDVLDVAELSESVDPRPLASAYVKSVAGDSYQLAANRTSESAAASLVRLAVRAEEKLRRSFFAPVDVRSRLAAAAEPGANPYTIEDDTARSLRAHIRILCRAVAGFEDSSPNDLTAALIEAVRVSAVKHDEKGRVGAFAARFETEPYRGLSDRPISADLAAALRALAEDQREKFLAVILDIDEPIILAQLIDVVPQNMRARIEERLDALTPSNAAAIRSLPEAMARIEALLTAERADAAARFVEAERGIRTFGKVPGRDLEQFRLDLRLRLVRREWSGIAQAEPPAEFSGQTRETALELLNFFKGVAELINPDGNPESAEHFFGALHQRQPHVGAYAVNLFSAKIRRLLGTQSFGELRGPSLLRGRQILAEAEQATLLLRDVSVEDLEIFNCNKAILLLALGQPDRAYGVLGSARPSRLGDSVAAYSAIALNRMGRPREALATLTEGARATGETRILREAREHVKSGTRFAGHINVTTGDGRIPRIRDALFELSHMDPYEQSAVFVSESEPLLGFVIDQVRAAAENVIALVTAMKGQRPNFHEDDLTSLIRMPLAASVRFLGWTVPDQSPGGYSAKGNPGKRDLVIQTGGWTLGVVEAVVCRDPVRYETVKADLTSHFQKLLGYSPCALFFHLTYSYVDDPATVISYLKQAAEREAPPKFPYRENIQDIGLTDSRPTGFVADYEGPLGLVKVAFLVLDMRQYAQEEAARLAGNR